MNTEYRRLTSDEIDALIKQECTSECWEKQLVHHKFKITSLRRVHFSGENKIGYNDGSVQLCGGVTKPCGIYSSTLHNCTIGNNVLIENIRNYIANYDIGDSCIIQNVKEIFVRKKSSFGNGIRVKVLNETGGREVIILNNLTSHLAYIMAFYKHNKILQQRIESMSDRYTESISSERGRIGAGSKIHNTISIIDCNIEALSVIEGASRLENGSINSTPYAPSYIGSSVVAENFIVSSGVKITNGVILSNCFVGQGTILGNLFSAHESLFFANCHGNNGEACSIFAGPYTVTEHKSSLLIAGMFSFLNAGSGSNQSNHLYKLGPIHQGIVERGSKTTSNSYILWPAKIGPFSLIMGRHVDHVDSSNLPFSYLVEQNNRTYLAPGINLRSVGTIRDAKKWPRRDRRPANDKKDCINFNLLSPYTIQKMIKGREILLKLQETCGETTELYSYQNMQIKKSSLKKGIQLYEIGINKFLGNSLLKKLENCPCKTDEEIREWIKPDTDKGTEKWIDLCGLITPRNEIRKVVKEICDEELTDIDKINNIFRNLHENYYSMEWRWVYSIIFEWYNKDPMLFGISDVKEIVTIWKDSVLELDNLIYEDAKKEFSLSSQVGFGMDHSVNEKELDFEHVRGDFENNDFVKSVKEHIMNKSALGDEMIERCRKAL